MGTRNLSLCKKDGQIKIAQYGQWDGYPSGQGATILKFCQSKENLQRLESCLPKIHLAKELTEFIEEYNVLCPKTYGDMDKRTAQMKLWWNTLIDDYISVETGEEAQRYAETMALQVQTENYGISIRNVKDI